jgi:hypothetical protein
MNYRRFNFALVGLILVALAMVGLFNLVIDPFWYFRVVEIVGFNRDKPLASANERWVKPPLAARLGPKAVIVGNSYSEIGLPPTHPGFTQQGSLPGYNLSLQGADWSEIYCLARYAIDHLRVRRVVVALYGTDEAKCAPHDEFARIDYGRVLFSRSAIEASRETLRQQDGKPFATAEGLWYMARYDESMQGADAIARNFARQLQGGLCDKPAPGSPRIEPAMIGRMPVAADKGMGLRTLIRSALAADVELVLLFNPTHVHFNEAMRQCNGAESHWQFRWQIVSIIDQETGGDTRLVKLWDFFAYVPMTAERVHAGKPMRERLWQDAGHFNHEVGTKVFDSIFGGVPGFGVELTKANFDHVVVAVEAQREAFLADNPWVIAELSEIFERARQLPPLPPSPPLPPR